MDTFLLLQLHFTMRQNIIFKTLIAASIVPVPILAILALLLNSPVIFTMGICITAVSVIALWIIYGIFRKCHKKLWRAFGYALLVMIPAPIAITFIAACFIPEIQHDMTSNVFNSTITLALALVFFGLDYLEETQK